MTAEELRAAHPELCASILAEGEKAGIEAGRKAGIAEERDRVVAHLNMGEASGDMKTALESVKSGATMTITLQSRYMAYAFNKQSMALRQLDSDVAGAAVDGPPPTDTAAPTDLVALFAQDLPKVQR